MGHCKTGQEESERFMDSALCKQMGECFHCAAFDPILEETCDLREEKPVIVAWGRAGGSERRKQEKLWRRPVL